MFPDVVILAGGLGKRLKSVTGGAQKEAVRLEKQGINIDPVPLTAELMSCVTTIDGAILMAPDTTCYAVGVILDGLASSKGTFARGSRYNSAIRYVDSSQYPCFILVVSEDHVIDIISRS